jgi:uncharacterized membrane protein (TIGR02234 family)
VRFVPLTNEQRGRLMAASGTVRAVAGAAVAGAVLLIASGRTWAGTTVHVPGLSASHISVKGHAVEPSLPALGIALLALAAAIIAARGRLRSVVGVVIVVVAAIAVGVAVAGRGAVSSALTHHEVGGVAIPVHGSANGWWLVAAAAALLGVLVGVVTTVRGGHWAAMGGKYDAPGAAPSRPAADPAEAAWQALDRGEDPTE